MIIIRGMSVTPDQIAQVLSRVSGGQPVFQIQVTRTDGMDQVVVLVEISDVHFFDEMKKQRRFVEALHRDLSESLGWEVTVRLVEPGTFDPERRVIDSRKFE